MQAILTLLQDLGISYELFEHPAVFTCEESDQLGISFPGASTKNLFLRSKKGNHYYLVTVGHEHRVDLKALARLLEEQALSFGSAEDLASLLGVEPGSVTLLGAIFDTARHVQIIIDVQVWNAGALQCHPLVNTATAVISSQGLQRFFAHTGHSFSILDVPRREDSSTAT